MSGSGDLLMLDEMLARRVADRAPVGRAKREIAEAWYAGTLTITGVLTERRAVSTLHPAPPPIEHGRVTINPCDGKQYSEWFRLWNWETNRAARYVNGMEEQFHYRDVGAPRHEFEALWPPKNKGGQPSYETQALNEAALILKSGWNGPKKKLAASVFHALKAKGIGASEETVKKHLRPVKLHKKKATVPVSSR